MQSKRCFKCGADKPLDDFYKHAAMGDGHLGKCIECAKTDAMKHRLANLDKIRAYDKARSSLPHRYAQNRRVSAKWRKEHPNRRAAQIMLGNALRAGKIRKLPCFVCGKKSEAHHPDYSAPLDVVWLCPPHHKQAHAIAQKVA